MHHDQTRVKGICLVIGCQQLQFQKVVPAVDAFVFRTLC